MTFKMHAKQIVPEPAAAQWTGKLNAIVLGLEVVERSQMAYEIRWNAVWLI